MPEVLHHDAELAYLLCVSTRCEGFSGVRMGQGNDVKFHYSPLNTAKTTLSTQEWTFDVAYIS